MSQRQPPDSTASAGCFVSVRKLEQWQIIKNMHHTQPEALSEHSVRSVCSDRVCFMAANSKSVTGWMTSTPSHQGEMGFKPEGWELHEIL